MRHFDAQPIMLISKSIHLKSFLTNDFAIDKNAFSIYIDNLCKELSSKMGFCFLLIRLPCYIFNEFAVKLIFLSALYNDDGICMHSSSLLKKKKKRMLQRKPRIHLWERRVALPTACLPRVFDSPQ